LSKVISFIDTDKNGKINYTELSDVVKLNVFLIDLSNFALVNTIMAEYFTQPYPARAAVGVASLPRGALVEADGVIELNA
jgi:enamine deaminase RidA (YjgF/YER057c/UK114 family)